MKTKTEKRASAYDGILDELNGHLEQMGGAHDLAQETIHSLKEHDIHITPLSEFSFPHSHKSSIERSLEV